jgi:hypothetical protein
MHAIVVAIFGSSTKQHIILSGNSYGRNRSMPPSSSTAPKSVASTLSSRTQTTPIKRSASTECFGTPGAIIDDALHTIQYSQAAQMALSGGGFDARQWLEKPQTNGTDDDGFETAMAAFRWKIKWLDLVTNNAKYLEVSVQHVEDKILGMSGSARNPCATSTRWPNTYIYWEKVSKYFRAEILLELLSYHGLTAQLMASLDEAYPTALNEMFDYIHCSNGKMKIYPPLKDKALMKAVAIQRIRALGRCTLEWLMALTRNLQYPLKVHWGDPKAGCVWYEGIKGKKDLNLVHCSGVKVAMN